MRKIDMRKNYISFALKLSFMTFAAALCTACGSSEGIDVEGTQGTIEAESMASEQVAAGEDGAYDFTICFAGDINLDENWYTTQYLNTCDNGIYDCIDKELIDAMNAADIMWLNNEFTYSTRGSAMPGKAYTFRANPERVEVLDILGVDIVGLANNHVYDYGEEAFLHTLDTMLISLHCYGDDTSDNIEVEIIPALQENCRTSYVSDPQAQRVLYDYLEGISRGVYIEDDGRVFAE